MVLGAANFPIREALRAFAHVGRDVGLLVPTDTGLQKSIMDAHADLRSFLKRNRIHDFDLQGQGPEHKVALHGSFVLPDRVEETVVTLYRPRTKSGDPRVWISGLKRRAAPTDLLCLVVNDGGLQVINVSDASIWQSRDDVTSPLGRILSTRERVDSNLIRLLELLSEVATMGFVRSLREGPTGIGFTLESLLGIKANADPTPDFLGIELKAHRLSSRSGKARTRTTLFSQVPAWERSAVGNARDLLQKYGYRREDDGRLQLYCTCGSAKNPQGLVLVASETNDSVETRYRPGRHDEPVLHWDLSSLQDALLAKHSRTAWVGADVRLEDDGTESFHYSQVMLTEGPIVGNLGPLIHTGDITMDLTLSERESGTIRDHGYLFKLHPESAGLLFAPPRHLAFDSEGSRFVEVSVDQSHQVPS